MDPATDTADTTEVLLTSTFSTRFDPREAVLARALEPFLEATFFAFTFKRMDLLDAGLAAFRIALDFCFAFVAMSVGNCKWIRLKSQGRLNKG